MPTVNPYQEGTSNTLAVLIRKKKWLDRTDRPSESKGAIFFVSFLLYGREDPEDEAIASTHTQKAGVF